MPFWFTLLIFAATTFVGELLKPKVERPRAKGLNEFNFPTAAETRPVPVIWGTVLQRAPNLLWYGDYKTTPIKQKGGPFALFGGKVEAGHRYHCGAAYSLCFGEIDAVEEIMLDDKSVWTGSLKSGSVSIYKPDLFGGDKERGGYIATLDIQPGTRTQRANAYLKSQLGRCTANRDICVVVQRGPSGAPQSGYVGTDENIEPVAFRVRRCPNNLPYQGANCSNVNGDANFAEVFYELLINDTWGMGVPAAQVNVQSFLKAAETLHNEGLGLSLIWDNQSSIKSMIEEFSRYIDGLLYIDLSTGLYNLMLARKDYDVNSLPRFDEDTIDELLSYTRGDLSETTNEVRVTYTDRAAGFKERIAHAHDPANFYMQGETVAVETDYRGISNAAAAGLLAQRDVTTLAFSPAKHTIRVNRSGHNLHEGAVYRWSWAEDGIVNQVMRVLSINYGRLQNGQIEITGVQDIFSLGTSVYGAPAATGWVDPITPATQIALADLEEAPYHFARDEQARLLVMAAQPNASQRDYDLHVSEDGAEYLLREDDIAWTPTGTLRDLYPAATADIDPAGFVIVNGSDLDSLTNASAAEIATGVNLLRVTSATTDEYMAFETVARAGSETTVAKVWRGLLDTAPQAHPAGARAWFISYGGRISEDAFGVGTKQAKLLSRTTRDAAALTGASVFAHTIAQRARKPYPPGNLRITDTSTTGASGSAGASPDTISGLSLWLKADALALADGASVETWTDSSGNAKHATQAASANRPAYRTNVINGKPALRFTPANSTRMTTPALSARTIFVVAKYDASAFSGYPGLLGDNGGNNTFTGNSGTGSWFPGLWSGAYYKDGVQMAGHDASPLNQFHIYAVAADTAWGTSGLMIGDDRNLSLGRFWSGDIAEIITYDRQLTDAERASVTDHLKAKYGFGGGSTVTAGQVRAEWSHRDRTSQPSVIRQTAGSIGPEAGASYTVKIYGETGQLLRTYANVAGASQDYPAAQELTDTGLTRLQTSLRIDVTAVCGTYTSNVHSRTITRA